MSKRNIILLILAAMSAVLLSACQTSVGPTTRVNDSYIHIRASWSPDGKSIAFSSTVQGSEGIYIVDSTGGNMRQVFKGVGVGAAWSPDGAWIVFSQSNSLYKMKPSGDSLTQITAAIGAIRPSWSKDGTKIAFIEADVNGTLGTFLLDVRTDSS